MNNVTVLSWFVYIPVYTISTRRSITTIIVNYWEEMVSTVNTILFTKFLNNNSIFRKPYRKNGEVILKYINSLKSKKNIKNHESYENYNLNC